MNFLLRVQSVYRRFHTAMLKLLSGTGCTRPSRCLQTQYMYCHLPEPRIQLGITDTFMESLSMGHSGTCLKIPYLKLFPGLSHLWKAIQQAPISLSDVCNSQTTRCPPLFLYVPFMLRSLAVYHLLKICTMRAILHQKQL